MVWDQDEGLGADGGCASQLEEQGWLILPEVLSEREYSVKLQKMVLFGFVLMEV